MKTKAHHVPGHLERHDYWNFLISRIEVGQCEEFADREMISRGNKKVIVTDTYSQQEAHAIGERSLRSAAAYEGKKARKAFSVRKFDGGFKVWRLA